MRAHKLDAYIDGRKRIVFCSVCGQEDDEISEECEGSLIERRPELLEPVQFTNFISAIDVDKLK